MLITKLIKSSVKFSAINWQSALNMMSFYHVYQFSIFKQCQTWRGGEKESSWPLQHQWHHGLRLQNSVQMIRSILVI